MVFYRKYRPQKIEELDNPLIREKLSSVLKSSSFHAFLFTGPKGLGKTSAARIVAKILNCEKLNAKRSKPTADLEPCNKCYQCQSITNGVNLDVLEIDAASNRGIDEIRDLREKIKLSTAKALKKVYIIDEVHMLTSEAFNALLKTLEEPPSHVVFILCTTEPQKVPATIASRCLHIPFTFAEKEELVRSLKRIVSKEKISIDPLALLRIASLSDGSFRDAAKILEEIVSHTKGRKITKELLEKHYQVSNISSHIENMRELLRSRRLKTALELVADLNEQGIDSKYFVEQLIEDLHGQLIFQIVESKGNIPNDFTVGELKKLITLLTKAHQEIKYAVIPSLPLELAIVEYCIDSSYQFSVVSGQNQVHQSSVSQTEKPTTEKPNSDNRKPITDNRDNFLDQLIIKVKPHNHSVAGLLRGCHLKNMNGKKVEIETSYKFHKDKLDERKTKELLEKLGSEILGKNVRISVELGGGMKK